MFLTEPLRPNALCNILSHERMGVFVMNRFLLSQVYVSHKSSLYFPGTDLTDNVVSTELFPSNGCCTVACLHSCYLAVGLHATILMDLSVS
jgi:hypothetical protein